jgi:pimeloyl-ACP methyl ester carboxylesterase/DNA-binding CsgD family transcriptional regulator
MARYPPQTRYAQSSGAKIAYQVSGTGPPDLIMVPGLVSHLDIQWQQTGYRRFVRTLERGGRLIRLDKRGTGLSDPAAELPTTQERVRDVAAVMAAAKSPRAALFGLSDGGRAAIAFAAAYPGRTQGLILYGTSYRGPRAALLRRYRSMVRHWGQGQIVDLVAPSLAGPQARLEAGAFERAAASPAMAAALIESLGLIDVRDLMSSLAVPTLVLHRQGDVVPVADARMVADQIPGATLKILPGRDHLPWAGDWASVAAEILAFLAQVGPARKEQTRGGRPGSRPPRPAVGWPSLTEAELPVVRLAAAGHTNADIAARLCLSRYTVETHLKHVFAKLGVESRTELAALIRTTGSASGRLGTWWPPAGEHWTAQDFESCRKIVPLSVTRES